VSAFFVKGKTRKEKKSKTGYTTFRVALGGRKEVPLHDKKRIKKRKSAGE